MGREVEADRLRLEGELLQLRPVGHRRQAQRLGLGALAAEQADLGAGAVLGRGLGAAQDQLGAGHQPGAVRLQPVEGAGLGEVLDLHLVEQLRVHARGEVGDAGERPAGVARRHHVLHGLRRRRASPRPGRSGWRPCRPPRTPVRNSAPERLMSGGSTAMPRRVASCMWPGELLRLVHVERHGGGEEGDRVVRLEPGGLVADQGVGGGVGLVEAVVGEALHQVEDLAGLGGGDAARRWRPRRRSRAASPSRRGSSCPWRGAAGRRRRASSPPAPARSASPAPGRP